jgi:formamidopyrimidine-DNA glycosylase
MLLGLESGETLVVHLRMTGAFTLVPAASLADTQPAAKLNPDSLTTDSLNPDSLNTDDPHVHLLFDLDDGSQLRYRDTRKFGRLWLVEHAESVIHALGPEPWDPLFTPEAFAMALAGRRAPIKALLLDQRIVAGVGNIYADESLWQAEILPTRAAGSLSVQEVARLHGAIRMVLERAIVRGGSSLGDGSTNYVAPGGAQGGFQEEFAVFHRTGKPCLRCGAPILRTVVAQRGTHYCGNCQG